MLTFRHLAELYIQVQNGWDFIALAGLLFSKMVWLFVTLACLGSVFFLVCFRETPRGVQVAVSMLCSKFALLAMVLALVEFLFYGLYRGGAMVSVQWVASSMGGVVTGAVLSKVGLRVAGLGLLLFAGYRLKNISSIWSMLGALLIVFSFGIGVTDPLRVDWGSFPFLAVLLVVHVTFAAFWVGSLWCILQLIDTHDFKQSFDILSRFNNLATRLLPLMVGAGLLLAWQVVGSWQVLFTTTYGITLLCKIAFFLCCFGLGLLNRVYYTPGLGGSKKEAYRAVHNLQIYVRLEIVVIGLIYFCTAILSVVTPYAS